MITRHDMVYLTFNNFTIVMKSLWSEILNLIFKVIVSPYEHVLLKTVKYYLLIPTTCFLSEEKCYFFKGNLNNISG